MRCDCPACVHASVPDLARKLRRYINAYSATLSPFVGNIRTSRTAFVGTIWLLQDPKAYRARIMSRSDQFHLPQEPLKPRVRESAQVASRKCIVSAPAVHITIMVRQRTVMRSAKPLLLCLVLLTACAVGRQHVSDAKLEKDFLRHEAEFQALIFRPELELRAPLRTQALSRILVPRCRRRRYHELQSRWRRRGRM